MDCQQFKLTYSDIAESEEFIRFCRILADLLRIRSFAVRPPDDIEGPGRTLSIYDLNPLCLMIQSTEKGARRCIECDKRHIEEVLETHKPTHYICHAGLMDFIVPIVIDNQVLALFIGGQFLPEVSSELGCQRVLQSLKDLGLDQKKNTGIIFLYSTS